MGVSGTSPPTPLPGENLVKRPIRAEPSGHETLRDTSRINFGKSYTVEHNLPIINIGRIPDDHMQNVKQYFKQEMTPD
jgi:hypothetical protein